MACPSSSRGFDPGIAAGIDVVLVDFRLKDRDGRACPAIPCKASCELTETRFRSRACRIHFFVPFNRAKSQRGRRSSVLEWLL
jgi:hypothetical protein